MARLCWILYTIIIIKGVIMLPEYHQDDYDLKFERAAMTWYNRSILRDVVTQFPFYNRTKRMLNTSFYWLHDMTSNEVVLELQAYKFLSMEYRHFPLRLAANLCKEFENNNFNWREVAKNISNLTVCPWKKGFYYIRNYVADYSRLPPFIPRGRYKLEARIYYINENWTVCNIEVYYEVVDKPSKWWKL